MIHFGCEVPLGGGGRARGKNLLRRAIKPLTDQQIGKRDRTLVIQQTHPSESSDTCTSGQNYFHHFHVKGFENFA
jgi:hypothetical protein